MSENRQHYTSDELSLNQAHSYALLLQVDTDSFNYAVIYNKQLLAWGENFTPDELRAPKQLRDILTANYSRVITGLSSTGFTLLPKNLFDANRVGDVARLLDVSKTEKVFADALDDHNVIIYKVNEVVAYAIKDFDHQHTVYGNAGWIKAIGASQPQSNHLYLNINNDLVSIVNFINNKLRFYNQFTFKNYEELIYFCALVTTEVGIAPQNAKLILSGDISDTDSYYTNLKNFFGEVDLNDVSSLTLPEGVAPHKILSLSALSLCASSEEV